MSEEFGPTVLLTIGPPGQQMHAAARRVLGERPTTPDREWYYVNITGTHLPQMYPTSEEIPLTGPIGAVRHGLCPFCLGWGWGLTTKVLSETGNGPCSYCQGTGRMGMARSVSQNGPTTDVSVKWDPKDMAQIACDLCREAFEVRQA